jgi:CheY-like chemotaxis protein
MAGQPRVILIENEPVLARQVEEFLCVAGFAVVTESSGERGLQTIAAEGIGVSAVLAEADMPDIGGVEIHEVLAECDPGLPALVMSRRLVARNPALIVHQLQELIARDPAILSRADSAPHAASELIGKSRQLRLRRPQLRAEAHVAAGKASPPCPKCSSARVAKILYGTDRLNRRDDLAAGTVVLGGVHRTLEAPDWHCRDCDHRWGS